MLISAARALPLTFDISILNTPGFGLPVGNSGNGTGNGANNADEKEATDASLTEGAVASFVVISKQVGQMRVNRCVAAFRASQFREKAVYK